MPPAVAHRSAPGWGVRRDVRAYRRAGLGDLDDRRGPGRAADRHLRGHTGPARGGDAAAAWRAPRRDARRPGGRGVLSLAGWRRITGLSRWVRSGSSSRLPRRMAVSPPAWRSFFSASASARPAIPGSSSRLPGLPGGCPVRGVVTSRNCAAFRDSSRRGLGGHLWRRQFPPRRVFRACGLACRGARFVRVVGCRPRPRPAVLVEDPARAARGFGAGPCPGACPPDRSRDQVRAGIWPVSARTAMDCSAKYRGARGVSVRTRSSRCFNSAPGSVPKVRTSSARA